MTARDVQQLMEFARQQALTVEPVEGQLWRQIADECHGWLTPDEDEAPRQDEVLW